MSIVNLLSLVLAGKGDELPHVFKVDISQDSGRRDVLAPDCFHWRIPESELATIELDKVKFMLRPLGNAGKMQCEWWKSGFDWPSALASDGVVVRSADEGEEAGLELRIGGLTAGKHSIVSYHNWLDGDDASSLTLEIDGVAQATNESFAPSRQVLHDDDCGAMWGEFEAVEGRDVVVRWKASQGSRSAVVLNGFAFDLGNPKYQVRKPLPFDGDEHAEELPKLKWTAVDGTMMHRVYFGSDYEEVANALPNSPFMIGECKEPELRLDLSQLKSIKKLDPLKQYYWRVDSIPANRSEPLVAGKVWRFKARRLAFPGAEGYGRFARGGMGGRVIEVTNLSDDGPGSLRAAVDAEGPRIVVFRVGGTITLKSKLVIRNPYLTVAGQTAPGGGICVRGYTFGCLGTHDVILRYVRIRVGDEAHLTMDGTGFASTDHAIMDHCSVSWSIDEGVSSRGAANITFQRCIVAEALNIADHKKYQPGKGHSFAASISGYIGSFHHNLFAHCAGRNWSLAGGLNKGGGFAGRLDIRNNVVFNWEHRTTDGGVKALNLVNNFYAPGPASRVFHLLKPDVGTESDPQQYFVSGNHMEGRDYDADNWGPASVVVQPEMISRIRLESPFCESFVTEHSAAEAYLSVMEDVGANLPALDSLDARILEDVRLRRALTKGGRSGIPGIIDSQTDSGGWPELDQGVAPLDQDHDGLPDEWERARRLNPLDPMDAQQVNEDFFSELEVYLNSFAPK